MKDFDDFVIRIYRIHIKTGRRRGKETDRRKDGENASHCDQEHPIGRGPTLHASVFVGSVAWVPQRSLVLKQGCVGKCRQGTFVKTLDGLPVIGEGELRKGRRPSDGYARGWGLEFGDLREQLLADPIYERSVAIAAGRTVQSELRRMNLYLLIKHYLKHLPAGNVLELGSYMGGSAMFMANAMRSFAPDAKMLALDTFKGMPYADKKIDAHSEGDFSGVDLGELRRHAADSGLDNLRFVEGRFEETLPGLIPEYGPFALVHVDCDVYDAIRYSYQTVKGHMVPGGYIVFDDATTSSCIGATEAVEEFVVRGDGLLSEQIFPHFVFRIGLT
jgi:predicted O-methyltransferase YrrM